MDERGTEAGIDARSDQRPGWPLVLLVATYVLLGASLGIGGADVGGVAVNTWVAVTATLGAAVVIRAGSFLGWLMLAATALGAVGALVHAVASAAVRTQQVGTITTVSAWLGQWIQIPAIASFIFVFLLFPSGRLLSPRWRWVAGGAILGALLVTVVAVLTPGPLAAQPTIDNPTGVEGAGPFLESIEIIASALIAIGSASALVSLVIRLRRAQGDEREQVKWLLFAAVLLVLTGFFAMITEGPLNELSFVALLVGLFALPASLAIALTKYRLYNIDLVINRALVYVGITGCVIVIYVLIVGFMGSLLQQRVGLVPALIATGIVAVVFEPIRRIAQEAVDRLMFGERKDPYVALTGLASTLQSAIEPSEVLPTIVETLARSLKLAYVGIEAVDEGGIKIAASVGDPGTGTGETIPLVYQGAPIGKLIVVPRRGDTLSPTDRLLVEALAKNAGAAVHAVTLTEALRKSRNEILAAREEERRRLRRDLHDGLGPELAGIALGVGAARNFAVGDPGKTAELLGRVQDQAEAATRSVRGLVDGLRPAALDDLGLVEAIRNKAESMFAGSEIELEVDAPADRLTLPAAVEVAAMRITLEAATNVIRHSEATHCRLTISMDDALVIEVIDDGQGIHGSRRGVGLDSMRERVEEVGGALTIGDGDGGGTRVCATLPLT